MLELNVYVSQTVMVRAVHSPPITPLTAPENIDVKGIWSVGSAPMRALTLVRIGS